MSSPGGGGPLCGHARSGLGVMTGLSGRFGKWHDEQENGGEGGINEDDHPGTMNFHDLPRSRGGIQELAIQGGDGLRRRRNLDAASVFAELQNEQELARFAEEHVLSSPAARGHSNSTSIDATLDDLFPVPVGDAGDAARLARANRVELRRHGVVGSGLGKDVEIFDIAAADVVKGDDVQQGDDGSPSTAVDLSKPFDDQNFQDDSVWASNDRVPHNKPTVPPHHQDTFPPEHYPTIHEARSALWMQNSEMPPMTKWVVVLPTADTFVHLGHLYYFLQSHMPREFRREAVSGSGDDGSEGGDVTNVAEAVRRAYTPLPGTSSERELRFSKDVPEESDEQDDPGAIAAESDADSVWGNDDVSPSEGSDDELTGFSVDENGEIVQLEQKDKSQDEPAPPGFRKVKGRTTLKRRKLHYPHQTVFGRPDEHDEAAAKTSVSGGVDVDSSNSPVLFAHVLPNSRAHDYQTLTCGPMIMNKAAWDLISDQMTKRDCPYIDNVSLTLGFCATTMGIPIVHTPAIACAAPGISYGSGVVSQQNGGRATYEHMEL